MPDSSPSPTPRTALLLAVALSVAACGTGETDARNAEPAATAAPTRTMPDRDAMRIRHADEADAVAAEAHAHIADMRAAGAVRWSERATAHADMVVRVTGTADRHWREMDMGMNRGDEGMGEMVGMSGVEYRRMRDQMRALRAEATQLRDAGEGEVGERLTAHLDQLEAFVRQMESSAAHMRG